MSNPFTGAPDTKPKISFLNGMPSGPEELKIYVFNIYVRDSLYQDVEKVMVVARSVLEAERATKEKFPNYERVSSRTWEMQIEAGLVIRG